MGTTKVRPLGNLELAIMRIPWKADRALTVREVHDSLLASRTLAYTSTLTVMNRLVRKGLLRRSEGKRPHAYRAARGQADYSTDLMLGILSEAGDRRAALVRFVQRLGPRETNLLLRLATERVSVAGRAR